MGGRKFTDILVVDDDTNFLKLLTDFLEEENFEVETAMSGKECINVVRNEDPDLVLLDIMMPGLDGWETYDKIESMDENPEIILVSFLESKPELETTGISDYIIKKRPFTKEKFLEPIRQVLGEI